MNPGPEQAAGSDHLLIGFVQHADLVVELVVAALLLGSIASWAIIVEKIVRILRLRGVVGRIEAWARNPRAQPDDTAGLVAALRSARDEERAEGDGHASLRLRRERAMRAAYLSELRRQESGLSFLATLAATAPFIGLFGTVWGIMHSFSSIAAANDTSLAVVAPGIAEALFATAIGLVAAIPAVVAYNLVRAALVLCNHRLAAATGTIARASLAGGGATP